MPKIALIAICAATLLLGQQGGMKDMAATDHQHGVDSRGDDAMGFSHEKTTHHFRLAPTGGTIQVDANQASDTESRDQIRMHLTHIAGMFAAGNFDAPMFIHDQTPPGVVQMKQLKGEIGYRFEKTTRGGRVVITTKNASAVKAVHDFLRFQITDHKTGDSPVVGK